MANRDIVAIGTSAGGVQALLSLAQAFPADFPATVLVTLHLSNQSPSSLDEILNRAGPLPAKFARPGDQLRKGQILIAPNDRHMLIEQGDRILLGNGARENNTRPAIDPMMRSIALCCGARAIGVVLTGTLGDGASGLWALDQCAGITVVQDPSDAAFPDMPLNALNRLRPDHMVTLAAMPRLLSSLVTQPAGEAVKAPESIRFEVEIAKGSVAEMDEMDGLGRRSVLACPTCHGVMWEIDEGPLTRFRCHVGHTFAAEHLSLSLDENLRRAMGSALRALEERLELARKLERDAEGKDQPHLAASWGKRASEYERELSVIRSAVSRMDEIDRGEDDYKAAE